MQTGARILLPYDPTRGVDVGTKRSIYAAVRRFAESGGAVLLYSSELPELVTSRIAACWRDEQAGRTPLRRLAAPEEVARAVLAVGTSLTFMTGAILPVDGGRPL
ncbi:MAG TPA: hypothetical protein VGL12_12215 [Roseiarcus sp.]|jgi:ABC-type sugar transport system ATPase subunit